MPEVFEHFMLDPGIIVRFLTVQEQRALLKFTSVLWLHLQEQNPLKKPGFGLQVAPAAFHHQVRNGSPYDAGLH